MSKPCSKCKGEMSQTILDPFSGEEGGLRLTVQGMPALICAQGHKRFANIEFAAQLMDLVMAPETSRDIPVAHKKGIFRKSYHCPGCERELPEAPTGNTTREVAAELPKAQPFKVVADIPVFRCPGCGKDSIHSVEETCKAAFKATANAYRSIDIHPS